METTIYANAITRLQSVEAIAAFTEADQPQPVHFAWYEGQPDETLSDENKTYPFNCPAIFFEFNETAYEKGNGHSQKAEGKLILHIVQLKNVDGIQGAENHAGFKKLTAYADLIIDILNGYPMPCSAKLYMTAVQKDHLNRALMVDKVTFSWNGTRRRALIA